VATGEENGGDCRTRGRACIGEGGNEANTLEKGVLGRKKGWGGQEIAKMNGRFGEGIMFQTGVGGGG